MAKNAICSVGTERLTFEKVWTMFQETDKRISKIQMETDRQMKELQRKTDEQIDKMNKNIGGISSAVGGIIESLVQGGLKTIMEKETGCTIHTVEDNLKYKDEAEIDCLLIGKHPKKTKQDVFICECKNNLDKDDVTNFFNKIHVTLNLIQNTGALKIKPTDNYMYIFGFSKLEKGTKELLENYRKQKKTIYFVKIGGDGSVKLIK